MIVDGKNNENLEMYKVEVKNEKVFLYKTIYSITCNDN